jgi:hypothetical protein
MQAAQIAGVSERTIRRALQDERLPGAVMVDGRWHIPVGARPSLRRPAACGLTAMPRRMS